MSRSWSSSKDNDDSQVHIGATISLYSWPRPLRTYNVISSVERGASMRANSSTIVLIKCRNSITVREPC